MELVEKYFDDLFHDSGPKNCVPVCPAEIVPWFHPHAVFHAYFIGSKDCSIKARQGLPFFTENYGPKWTEYTTVVHEIAGHHLEVWTCLILCLLSSYHLLHSHVPPCTRIAHKAFTCPRHRLLDTPILSHAHALDISLSSVLHHVVFGKVLFHFTSGAMSGL